MIWAPFSFCSPTQHDAEIAQVVVRGPGHQRVAQRGKERIRIEPGERRVRIESQTLCPLHRGFIRNRTRGDAVPVNSIASRAEHHHGFAVREIERTGQGELLIAAAGAVLASQTHGDFTAGEQT